MLMSLGSVGLNVPVPLSDLQVVPVVAAPAAVVPAPLDVAVVAVKPPFGNELFGVARILGELKQQFDVVTENSRWGHYRTLILPDTTVLTDGLKQRIESHLKGGGGVIASGWSGLDPARKVFVLPAWGLDRGPDEEQPISPTGVKPSSFSTPLPFYFHPGPEISAGTWWRKGRWSRSWPIPIR